MPAATLNSHSIATRNMATVKSEGTSGQCRCCLQHGSHSRLTDSCEIGGLSSVYRDVFWDCFNLDMVMDTELTDLICASCVCRLNDAAEFKIQVTESQQHLLRQIRPDSKTAVKGLTLAKSVFINVEDLPCKVEIKVEPDESEDAGDNLRNDDDSDGNATHQNSRSRPPKQGQQQTTKERFNKNKKGTMSRPTRKSLPPEAVQIMKTWLTQHAKDPYPTEAETQDLASQTKLTIIQIKNWFINARRRILPMMEYDKQSGTSPTVDIKLEEEKHHDTPSSYAEVNVPAICEKTVVSTEKNVKPRTIACRICQKKFSFKTNLNRHIKMMIDNQNVWVIPKVLES
ncbi:homeobox KN domain-containing protein [Phthorimaea operculella]|nr:homeobox KN domain-containing protein [Phthorimaea operculella]